MFLSLFSVYDTLLWIYSAAKGLQSVNFSFENVRL